MQRGNERIIDSGQLRMDNYKIKRVDPSILVGMTIISDDISRAGFYTSLFKEVTLLVLTSGVANIFIGFKESIGKYNFIFI